MGQFQVKNLDWAKVFDSSGKFYDLLKSIQDEINAQKAQTGAAGVSAAIAPSAPQALSVSAAGGIFQIAVRDNQPGVNYFLEYDTVPGFTNPRLIPLGPGAVSHRTSLGNQTLFWRVKAGYPTSPHASPLSPPTYFTQPGQTKPSPVQGGGATIGPPA